MGMPERWPRHVLGAGVNPVDREASPRYSRTVAVKRSAEQEPLVEVFALVEIPGAPLVMRDLPLADQRFECAKRIVEIRGRLFHVHPDQDLAQRIVHRTRGVRAHARYPEGVAVEAERLPRGNEWHYKDVRNFQRDFKEAFDQITNFYRSDTWFTKISATGWDALK